MLKFSNFIFLKEQFFREGNEEVVKNIQDFFFLINYLCAKAAPALWLTLVSVWSLNNPLNVQMNFSENLKLRY